MLAADVLYERANVALLLSLLPRFAPEAWLADPGRPAAGAFLEQARRRWPVETRVRGVVQLHRLELGSSGSRTAGRDYGLPRSALYFPARTARTAVSAGSNDAGRPLQTSVNA